VLGQDSFRRVGRGSRRRLASAQDRTSKRRKCSTNASADRSCVEEGERRGDYERKRGFQAEHFSAYDGDPNPAQGKEPRKEHPGAVGPRTYTLLPTP
jgi:hypothetical protein